VLVVPAELLKSEVCGKALESLVVYTMNCVIHVIENVIGEKSYFFKIQYLFIFFFENKRNTLIVKRLNADHWMSINEEVIQFNIISMYQLRLVFHCNINCLNCAYTYNNVEKTKIINKLYTDRC
jgi:hypothetical protein